MGILLSIVGCFLFFSIGLNLYLFHIYKKSKLKPPPQDSYEVSELLSDLLSGASLIEVRRIAPTEFFLRSPRSK